MNQRLVQIFRSPLKDEMYLYVDKGQGLNEVPELLLRKFGEPENVMVLMLNEERKLARADAREVLEAIEREGFYLQMPPTAAEIARRDGQGD